MKELNTKIRCAELHEISALNQLIKESSINLGVGYYSSEQIAGLNQYVFGVDSELVTDKTYFVAERDGLSMACGGWSKRATLFGGDQCSDRASGLLNPITDAAKIRAFFIHPNFARQGLGTLLLSHCEMEARNNKFKKMELMSTMPGVQFYRANGFIGETEVEYQLPNAVVVKLLPMSKIL